MRGGDRNTKFFHASVKGNRGKKRIEKLMDVNGNFQRSEAGKGEVATTYFQNLFKSSNPRCFNRWFAGFVPKVTEGMNVSLIRMITKEEIKVAAFSIKPSSAPGPDGMSGLFFQFYWDIVGGQVTAEVMNFFATGIFPEEWNYTHLCLLPKTTHPVEMANLRPISLCSVLYKIISKVLVKRLQPFLPLIVSEFQSAFISERMISDNILIAHELVHSLNAHQRISKEFMAIKSDMSKAYDRVEWSYLRELMVALGFHERWIFWVMRCVTTVTYSVLINDQPFGMIVPQRGLRQGDPLSPFLFVLCTEGLSHMLNKAHLDGSIEGIRFSDQGPTIHHLLFADDSLFLCKVVKDQCLKLQSILNSYGAATGQTINLLKSSISFGSKVCPVAKKEAQNILGIYSEGGAGKYLGLPECFSGSKVEMLSYIKDSMKGKLSNWYSKSLSQGGKEILLKSVAMAMPVFAMSCFKLPQVTVKNLASAMADFWWSSSEHSRKIHWKSWEYLCLPKHLGGMGFRDIGLFNQALLAKQAWKVLHFPMCLLSRLLKSRYFPQGDFLVAGLGNRPSFGWRSVSFGKDLLSEGLMKRVGNGASIKVWGELWIEDNGLKAPLMKNHVINIDLLVKDLVDGENRRWDKATLDELFYPDDVARIMVHQPVISKEDFFVWKPNKNGFYSVKSGYLLACQLNKADYMFEAAVEPSLNPLREQIWSLKIDPKIQIFLWKMLCGAIPVDERCQICGVDGESINHVIFTCTFARQVWAMSDYPSPVNGMDKGSVYSNIHHLLVKFTNILWTLELRRSFPWIIWRIWKNRNSFLFDGDPFDPGALVGKIKNDVEEWILAQAVLDEESARLAQSPRVERLVGEERLGFLWEAPPEFWVKCNIGISWSKRNKLAGVSWVLRDDKGVVLLHSRRAFANLANVEEGKFL
uniref:Putative mitochondrial protein n=1 Tax=Noccaea caerulescens TaxID=107243 RepID=A0A1J3E4V1_NOCCA